MSSLQEIITLAKEELKAHFEEDSNSAEEIIFELTDNSVPIYSHELMELASEPDIFFHENELPLAFDGEATLNNIVATAVYELVSEALNTLLYELQEEEVEA